MADLVDQPVLDSVVSEGILCSLIRITIGQWHAFGSGRAVYLTILEGFLYLSAGIAVVGKIGRYVRLLPPKRMLPYKGKGLDRALPASYRPYRCNVGGHRALIQPVADLIT